MRLPQVYRCYIVCVEYRWVAILPLIMSLSALGPCHVRSNSYTNLMSIRSCLVCWGVRRHHRRGRYKIFRRFHLSDCVNQYPRHRSHHISTSADAPRPVKALAHRGCATLHWGYLHSNRVCCPTHGLRHHWSNTAAGGCIRFWNSKVPSLLCLPERIRRAFLLILRKFRCPITVVLPRMLIC